MGNALDQSPGELVNGNFTNVDTLKLRVEAPAGDRRRAEGAALPRATCGAKPSPKRQRPNTALVSSVSKYSVTSLILPPRIVNT
jgi:hypothetical protein